MNVKRARILGFLFLFDSLLVRIVGDEIRLLKGQRSALEDDDRGNRLVIGIRFRLLDLKNYVHAFDDLRMNESLRIILDT